MCCFSGDVRAVSSTRIYAAGREGIDANPRMQRLVYDAKVALEDDVAMVLPIPVPPRSPEDAVRFVDMSSAPRFFDSLEVLFPSPDQAVSGELRLAPQPAARAAKLEVHTVGAFEASFVPTMADFARLDARFRLPSGVFEAVPEYADWGFAVFKLKSPKQKTFWDFLRPANREAARLHPMAFDFPRRTPRELFFPTVHVHDGAFHEEAHFDHVLYAQPDPSWERDTASEAWRSSAMTPSTLGEFVAGFTRRDAKVWQRKLVGKLPNRDQRFASR